MAHYMKVTTVLHLHNIFEWFPPNWERSWQEVQRQRGKSIMGNIATATSYPLQYAADEGQSVFLRKDQSPS
jgi:hypothetical protein